jgi:hypothetical protein
MGLAIRAITLTCIQALTNHSLVIRKKEIIMKLKLTALILALTVASWAQTTIQNPAPPATQENAAPQAKSECACCAKMATAKDGHSCCQHEIAGKDEKAMSSSSGEKASGCCSGKEAKSCMKDDSDKSAATCGDCCGKDHEKNCCASHNKGDKTAMSCGDGKQCGEHCASHASAGASK